MNRFTLFGLSACLLLCCSLSASAQDKGYWRAASSTSKSVTGDIVITDAKLEINFASWTIAEIRSLTPAEAMAAFDVDSKPGEGGNLYRLNIPASRRFLHHNTLCGSEDTRWMVTYVSGRTLYLDFFSTQDIPKLTFDALNNSTDLCATFTYTR